MCLVVVALLWVPRRLGGRGAELPGAGLMLEVFLLPEVRQRIRHRRIQPWDVPTSLSDRASFSVVSAGEAFEVSGMDGPIATPSILRSMQFDEAVVQGQGVSDAVSPTSASTLQSREGFIHVLVDVAESGAMAFLAQDCLSDHGGVGRKTGVRLWI